jgi:hypothetical protein
MSTSIKGRALALVAGAAFTGGALTILLGPALLKPWEWTSYHVLTVLAVFGTTAAGHLLAEAGFKNPLAAFGFLVLFIGGTGLVVANSIGRQATTFEENALSAEAANKAIADKTADLEQARARKAYADAQVQKETGRRGCGRNCRDWQRNSKDVAIVIAQLEKEIAALGPKKPVNAKAERMAEMAALFGVNKAKAKAMYVLLEPLLNCLFYELGSIVSLGFAFRKGKRPVLVAANDSIQTDFSISNPASEKLRLMISGELPEPTPPKPGNRKKPRFPASNVVDFQNHPVVTALEKNGGSVSSNQQLAALMGVCEAESTKRVQEIEGRLQITRNGKAKCIALRA